MVRAVAFCASVELEKAVIVEFDLKVVIVVELLDPSATTMREVTCWSMFDRAERIFLISYEERSSPLRAQRRARSCRSRRL